MTTKTAEPTLTDPIVPDFGGQDCPLPDAAAAAAPAQAPRRKFVIICSKGNLDMAYPGLILASAALGEGTVLGVRPAPGFPGTRLLDLRVDPSIANRVAGVRFQKASDTLPLHRPLETLLSDDAVVCRCERVTAGEIRGLLRSGVRDMNQLKAITRAGFGACGLRPVPSPAPPARNAHRGRPAPMTNIDTPKHLEPEDRDSPIPGGQNARGSATADGGFGAAFSFVRFCSKSPDSHRACTPCWFVSCPS